ncbi:hypothetical protein QNE27_004235 [Vibrio alginolyticus]|nr:hypothetical protein [Vibrio alginolyticus]ELA8378489.1 hypothetical protein [Vibrio alginolyticus]ELB2817342.1 hypothetical protein [Vibrio alginolyticus]
MTNINFEERAVAFIDVLGFKAIVDNAAVGSDNFELLRDLIGTLENALPNLNSKVNSDVPTELIPKHIYISDSIILSAPLSSEKMKGYCGLSILVMRVIQLTHLFLSKGYLIRGGISIGKVWHSDSNIVGPAYQEAYLLETKTGVPRIELSDSAKAHWDKINGKGNFMCLDYRNCFMVNGLHDYYIQDFTHGAAERKFGSYLETINQKLSTISNESARYKWWWYKEFLESEISRNDYIVHT